MGQNISRLRKTPSWASDIAADQVQLASALAQSEGLLIDFQIAAATENRTDRYSLDAVTANQIFLYFDTKKVVANLQRWLKPEDVLVIPHFFWLPSRDAIAKASEDLILQRNTNWQGAGYTGLTPPGFPVLGHDMYFSGYL